MSGPVGRPPKRPVTWAMLYEAHILYQLDWSLAAIARRVGTSPHMLKRNLGSLVDGPGLAPADPIPTCKYGHEMTDENTARLTNRPTARICIQCRRRRDRERWARTHGG